MTFKLYQFLLGETQRHFFASGIRCISNSGLLTSTLRHGTTYEAFTSRGVFGVCSPSAPSSHFSPSLIFPILSSSAALHRLYSKKALDPSASELAREKAAHIPPGKSHKQEPGNARVASNAIEEGETSFVSSSPSSSSSAPSAAASSSTSSPVSPIKAAKLASIAAKQARLEKGMMAAHKSLDFDESSPSSPSSPSSSSTTDSAAARIRSEKKGASVPAAASPRKGGLRAPTALSLKRLHPANGDVRVPEVALTAPDGEVTVVLTSAAQALAASLDLDLIVTEARASPPMAILGRYDPFIFEKLQSYDAEKKSEREAEKATSVKELKVKPRAAEHDVEVKVKRALGWLENGHRVSVAVMYGEKDDESASRLCEQLIERLRKEGKAGIAQPKQKRKGTYCAVLKPKPPPKVPKTPKAPAAEKSAAMTEGEAVEGAAKAEASQTMAKA